jgi:olefin beta-lactone synthetase
VKHELFPDDIFNLADIVLEVSRRDPERVAVIEPHGRNSAGTRRYRRHTYRELSHDVESVAAGLRDIGVAERARTVFMAPPSYDGCVIGLALTRVGATTVWIDPAVGYHNVAERLRRLKIEAFVGIPVAHLGRMAFGWGPRFHVKAIVVGGRSIPGAHSLESLRRPIPAACTPPGVKPGDAAAIMYTTGSTGPAKPALYQHRNLCHVFRLAHRTWRFDRSGDCPVDMPVFPAFFAVGLSAGGTIVIPPINYVRQTPAKVNPRSLLEVISDCNVQTLFASPVILENLARLGRDEGATARSLHTVIGGGAPLYASVVGPLRRMIAADGEVHADYGATEALPATEMPALEALARTYDATSRGRGLCVGRPFAGVAVKIVNIVHGPIGTLADARELPLGEIGEIIVRGPHVSPEYADDRASNEKNKIADTDGGVWHRLGDAGYLDDEGRLWCCGRVSHRIELPDGRLFPLMCEPIFDAHPSIRRSGLVAVHTLQASQPTPVICVEPKDDLVRPDEFALLREELLGMAAANPTTAHIRHLLFHQRLPVDPRHNSKIERPQLSRWAAKHLPNELRVQIAARPAAARSSSTAHSTRFPLTRSL